jgi:hypothetical protein
MRMRHIVICGLPGFSVFFHIIAWFSIKKNIELKMRVSIFSTNVLSEIFLVIMKSSARTCHKFTKVYMQNTR